MTSQQNHRRENDAAPRRGEATTLLCDSVIRDSRLFARQLWMLPTDSRHVILPLPTPSSIMRCDLELLSRMPYLVSFKSDGVRSILLFGFVPGSGDRYAVYIARNGRVSAAPPGLQVSSEDDDDPMFQGTLLDGEIMENGDFVVFDLVAVDGESCLTQSLSKRLELAQKVVERIGSSSIRVKVFVPATEAEKLFENFDKNCPTDVDGIVLAPENDSVGLGRLVRYFKLKAPSQNTIDLLWRPKEALLQCGAPGNELVEEAIRGVFWSVADFGDEGIYECCITTRSDVAEPFEHLVLTPKAARHDKEQANSKFVVCRTVQNLVEGLTGAEVFKAITATDQFASQSQF